MPVVGAVYAGLRFDGVLVGRVRKDGRNSTAMLTELILGSRFHEHLQLVLLNGIALGGFNVVDVRALSLNLGLPVLVVTRKAPDYAGIREALFARFRDAKRRWALIESLEPMVPVENVWVQRVGLSSAVAREVVRRLAVHGHVPEPLRVAHLMAGAVVTGESRGRA